MTDDRKEPAGFFDRPNTDALKGHDRTILDHLPQCVYLKDRRLRFVAANQAFCASVSRPEAEVLGCDDLGLYPRHLADNYRAAEWRVLEEGTASEGFEDRLIVSQLRSTHAVKMPVRDADGAVTGVLGVFWDVTDQRRLETQLRQRQKMEAVVQLAGGIAHDFNNLLTGILNNLSLVHAGLSAAQSPEVAQLQEHLSSAERIGRRAAELVGQLLAFARRMQLRPEMLDLNHAVAETVRALKPSLNSAVKLEVLPEPDLWPVQADEGQIRRVLLNLCGNARDAMPYGGRLRVETMNVTLNGVAVREHLDGQPGDYVRVRISDTGDGIAADVLPRVFDPFFTTKDLGKGTGLGLAMALGIVKEHQGWITGHSQLGKGSQFEIYLPRAEGSLSDADQENDSPRCARPQAVLR